VVVVSEAFFLELRPLLLAFPTALAQQVLRTWLNSWTMSRRTKVDSVSSCIFSCDANDDSAHYLRCPRLWEAIQACDRFPVPVYVGARLSFRPFSKLAIFSLVVVSNVQHSLHDSFHVPRGSAHVAWILGATVFQCYSLLVSRPDLPRYGVKVTVSRPRLSNPLPVLAEGAANQASQG